MVINRNKRRGIPSHPSAAVPRLHKLKITAAILTTMTAIAMMPNGLADATGQATAKSTQQVATATVTPLSLSPLDVHPRTSLTIVEQLRHNHYLKKPLDDNISSQVFDKYLTTLDGGRAYFLASDIDSFEQYRHSLDDALKRGNLDPAFKIFNTYQNRLNERLKYLLSLLNEGVETFDFTKDEFIEIDREDSTWLANQAAQDDLWRKRLKAAVLSMKLNGKENKEIGELLTKRYKNRLKQTDQTKSEDAFQLYVNAFAATYDPHTQYFSPRTSENFNINMSLSLEGIGAVLRTDDDYTAIVRLVPAGPADKSTAIKPNDRIVSVGQGETGKLIDVVGWRLDDVVELIRGPKGSLVRLEVIPADSETELTKVVEITREAVQLEEQAAQKKILTLHRGGQNHRVGIIEIPTFYVDFKALQQGDKNFKSTTKDVKKLISELIEEGIDGLVIDLRNNGGGSLQEADSLTGLFIKSGPTVQVKSARRRPNIYADTDDQVAWDGPLGVLVNRLSASASEIFAGAIQDYERGIIIGSQTFGKGTVQTLIPLNRGQLKITAAKFYRVSGKSTQHQGILPDIAFPELYDVEQIGESSLDDAMPWDMIQPAVYPRSEQIQPVLSALNERHQARAVGDPDFAYLRALASKSREASHRKLLSLNLVARQQEKVTDDAWRLDLENGLRAATGKEPLADLDQLDEEIEAQANAEEKPDPAEDALLRESGNIILDYIGMTRQIAQVESLDEPAGKTLAESAPQIN